MCLTNDSKAVEKFLSKHKNHKMVTIYKELASGNRSPYIELFKYKQGWNYSNSKSKRIAANNRDIALGIHVYLQNQSNFMFSTSVKMIKAKALISDLRGINIAENKAVFTKIYIPKGQL